VIDSDKVTPEQKKQFQMAKNLQTDPAAVLGELGLPEEQVKLVRVATKVKSDPFAVTELLDLTPEQQNAIKLAKIMT
jgi:hypothetical protein